LSDTNSTCFKPETVSARRQRRFGWLWRWFKSDSLQKKKRFYGWTQAQLDQLLHPRIDPKADKNVLCKGLPASPGAATGQIVFDPDTAEAWTTAGKKVILVRVETSPEDIHGMSAAQGILTTRGGMTSHAAVVARGMGKPCISGCSSIKVSYERKELHHQDLVLKEGDYLTIDGTTGEVIEGEVPTIEPVMNEYFQKLMKWVDQARELGIRTNADTPEDAQTAREFGAEGIGLCRTEHMFFEEDRIGAVRQMILADSKAARTAALEKILPMQKSDFKRIFQAMDGLPVTIRLLDPPLHEFIPSEKKALEQLASQMGLTLEKLERRVEGLHEFNPMLGHRGVRLAVSFPEIYRTQTRAIAVAVAELYLEKGIKAQPEIMIPLVGHWKELELIRKSCEEVIEEVRAEFKETHQKKIPIQFKIGTMIELPRACLTANEIAEHADFFSFGTNDLTQTTYGLSRDDSGMFLKDYLDHGVYEKDPFASLDQAGVGELVEIGLHRGREVKPDLKVGICGEHGGDPSSVEFCHRIGLDYVSCSPYRVPIARLAAAQAAIQEPRKKGKVLSAGTQKKTAATRKKAVKKTATKKKNSNKKKAAKKKTASKKKTTSKKKVAKKKVPTKKRLPRKK
jgi:pyruvate, orthophosphate dikinase